LPPPPPTPGDRSKALSSISSNSPDDGSVAAVEVQPEECLTRNQASLLKEIRCLRNGDGALCDVRLLVGADPTNRRVFNANSTILALRSTFFKSLFFGPNAVKAEEMRLGIVLDNVEPEVFDRVLDFIDGGDEDENNHNGGFWTKSASLRLAWLTRAAAQQLGLPDLVAACDRHLLGRLTFRNGLEFLAATVTKEAEELRPRIFRVLANRGESVLTTANMTHVSRPSH